MHIHQHLSYHSDGRSRFLQNISSHLQKCMHHILANQSWLSACLQSEYDAVASILINVIKNIMDGIGQKHAMGPKFTKEKLVQRPYR